MSNTTTITETASGIALINVFKVEPDNQQPLVDLLDRATADTMQHIDGFISANIHKSMDGKTVANYAQWRSRDAFMSMLKDAEAQVHMKAALDLCTEPNAANLYEVAAVYCRPNG